MSGNSRDALESWCGLTVTGAQRSRAPRHWSRPAGLVGDRCRTERVMGDQINMPSLPSQRWLAPGSGRGSSVAQRSSLRRQGRARPPPLAVGLAFAPLRRRPAAPGGGTVRGWPNPAVAGGGWFHGFTHLSGPGPAPNKTGGPLGQIAVRPKSPDRDAMSLRPPDHARTQTRQHTGQNRSTTRWMPLP